MFRSLFNLQALRNINIGIRLIVGFSILIALTILLGVADQILTSTQDAAFETLQSAETALLTLEQINTETLEARRREKDFLLRWQEEGYDVAYENYITLNQEHTDNVLNLTDEVRELTNDVNILTRLNAIDSSITSYRSTFNRVLDDIETRGFVDTGLEGVFRASVAALESSSVFNSSLGLQVTLLQIRRHEKDYLLRGDQDDVDTTLAFLETLREQIRVLSIVSATERQLLSLVDNYETNFTALVELDAQIATEIDVFRAAAENISPLVDNMIVALQEVDVEATDNYNNTAQLNDTISFGLIVSAVVIGITLAFLIYQSISGPVARLTQIAIDFAAGNRDNRVQSVGRDELTALGHAFNDMADEINKLIVGLEARTKDMQTVVDVSNQISTVLDVNRLLQDVVDLTKERFALYHAHIYIMNEEEQELTLTAGAGHVGRQMVSEIRTIDANNKQSIVAGAARNRRGAIVNDVTASPNFLAHRLLPNTKSELAVPLIARGRVLGVLDVQSDEVGHFTEEVFGVLEVLASQIATALSNASLFEVAERTSRHEQALSTIDRQIQQATDVDEMLQIVVRELGKALRVQHTAIELSLAINGSNKHSEELSNV